VLSVEDWAEIRRLHRAEGLPIKVIVRTLGVSRNTVRAALASDGPPKYERAAKATLADGFEPRWMFGQTSDEASYGSSHDIWLHFDRGRLVWGKVTLSGSSYVSAALAIGPHAVWAFTNASGRNVYAWYHDRGSWNRIRLPVQ
jgi:hypothetical protein